MDNTKLQLQKLNKQLEKIEIELDKCRTSSYTDGWQSQKHSKKSRKWDYYAQEKMRIKGLIQEIELNIDKYTL